MKTILTFVGGGERDEVILQTAFGRLQTDADAFSLLAHSDRPILLRH